MFLRPLQKSTTYSLTPVGESLKPIIDSMHEWGIKHISEH
ncbi:winged helix-turn-helix transcriptional regulator [Microcoleus sp. AR_TQ3_B6]